MTDQPSPHLSRENEKVLDSIRPTKIILPVIIGLGVIIFLIGKQVNLEEMFAIRWNVWSFMWVIIAISVYFARHLLYSYRLRVLSEQDFSWGKSIELVTILEFASAVSPTNFGGSAVAVFLLIQEKLSAARAASIVIYTIIADTLFFVFSFPVVYFLFGANFFYPIQTEYKVWSGMGTTLVIVWLVMAVYGLLLTYGLFIKPSGLRRLLESVSRWAFLKKSKERIEKAAADIEVSSIRIKGFSWHVHVRLALATLLAWILRFFTVTAILIALDPSIPQTLYDHIILLGRGQSLYAVSAYSPTPGGSGVAEIIFGQFYGGYVSVGIAVIAAVLWRVITYYPYLVLGVIIIPNWIRKLINRRRLQQ